MTRRSMFFKFLDAEFQFLRRFIFYENIKINIPR